MTDIQITNPNPSSSGINNSKKDFEHRLIDDPTLRKLCVKNIPKDIKENELLVLFEKFGAVESIKLKVNKNIGPYALYAYVLFRTPEEAKRCFKQSNGYVINGRALRMDLQKFSGILDEEEENSKFTVKNNFKNNKHPRKGIRTNQFHNNRNLNNKRLPRNEVLLNEEGTGSKDLDTPLYNRQYEQQNKRPKYNNNSNSNFSGPSISGNRNLSLNNRSSTVNTDGKENGMNKGISTNETLNEKSFLSISTVLNKLETMQNSGEAKNGKWGNENLKNLLLEYANRRKNNTVVGEICNEIDLILHKLVDEMDKKPRVKLQLFDHVKKSAQHVFKRPCINPQLKASLFNDNSNSSTSMNISYNQNPQIQHEGKNAPYIKTNNPLTSQVAKMNVNGNDKNIQTTNGTQGNQEVSHKVWSGMLEMKRSTPPLAINAYSLKGSESHFLNPNISSICISHRKRMNGIPQTKAVYIFELQNKNDSEILDSYKKYFSSKDRVGLVSIEEWFMYIIFPGSDVFNKFLPNNVDNVFLGLVCMNSNTTDAQTQSQLQKQGTSQEHYTNSNKVNIQHSNMYNTKKPNEHTDHPGFNSGNKGEFVNTPKYANSQKMQNRMQYTDNTSRNNTMVGTTNMNQGNITQMNTNQGNTNQITNNEHKKDTNSDDLKDKDIPGWLNQFSSLAAYLVKK